MRRKGNPFEMSPWIQTSERSKSAINELLQQMSLDSDRPFILLSVRDATYYEYLRSKGDRIRPGREIEADTFVRNPDIGSYLKMAATLNDFGIQVIRFGISFTPLPKQMAPFVTDYSMEFRTPERDLLLAQHCRAMVSGNSGAWCFASLYNKPVLCSDISASFANGVSNRDVIIPQLLLDTSTNRLFSFREMMLSGEKYFYEDACRRDGIALVKNSSEEITEAVLELLDLDEGIREKTTDDYQLLARFQRLRESGPVYQAKKMWQQGRIGLRFLRRYRSLLY